jgi:hypothetical protein
MALSASSLLPCYNVWVHPTRGNVVLHEVFTNFRVTGAGTRRIPFSLYALLIGNPGETATLQLQCIEQATGRMYAQAGGPATIGGSGKSHLHIRLDQYQFPRPGLYRFVLTADQQSIAELSIAVRQV